MNKKSMVCVILSVVMIIGGFSMGGCQLAKEDAAEGALGDKLIGIYITLDTINPLDWFSGESKYADDEKIYATKVEVPIEDTEYTTCEYRFEEFDGIPFFEIYVKGDSEHDPYRSLMVNNSVFDAYKKCNYSDDICYIELTGNIYFSDVVIIYPYPVYQEDDGDVYMLPNAMGEEVSKYSASQSFTIKENKANYGCNIKVTMDLVGEPKNITFIAMDKEDKILWQATYNEGEVPETMQMPDNTEYLIVKTAFEDGKESRIDTYKNLDSYIYLLKRGSSVALEKESVLLKWE